MVVSTIIDSSTVYIQQSGNNIQYQIGSTQGSWTNIFFPVTIINSNTSTPLNVKFHTNLTLNNANQYFITDSSYINVDGQSNTVSIDNVTGYPGLIRNGTNGINGFPSIHIENIIVNGESSTLSSNGGWIGQEYFGSNSGSNSGVNSATNCSSLGSIPIYGGGIFGYQTSYTTATGCNSTGLIETNAGGIFGYFSYECSAVNCFSIGNIGQYSGGIFGPYTINCVCEKSYSLGNINNYGGGIFGFGTNYVFDGIIFYPVTIVDQDGNTINTPIAQNDYVIPLLSTVTDCYSLGSLGSFSGGIYGYFAYKSTVSNSYSIGNGGSSTLPGGIFAANYYNLGGGIVMPSSTNCTTTKTYTAGSYLTEDGIFALTDFGNTSNSSLGEGTGTWLDNNAKIYLTGVPAYNNSNTLTEQGTIWIDTDLSSMNTPWLLKSFNNELYDQNTIDINNLNGTTNNGIISSGVDYQIIDINNTSYSNNNFTGISTAGAITYAGLTEGNTYTIRVLRKNPSSNPAYRYQINTLTLNTPLPLFTNFTLSPLQIDEGVIYKGTLTSDSTQSTSYSIINQPYQNLYISGDKLIARYPFSNYLDNGHYDVKIRAISSNVVIQTTFRITVNDIPQPPTNITITNNKIPEDSSIDTFVGKLNTTDPDRYDVFKYEFVSGEGSDDNSLFKLNIDDIYLNTTFNEKGIYYVRVRSTDLYGYSIEVSIKLYVIKPIANDMNLSALLHTNKVITLDGTGVSGKPLTYTLLSQPKYGNLKMLSNGVYNYLPLHNKIDSFDYSVSEGTMTSLPGTLIINNFSQEDIDNIPKKQGTFTFNNISFNGDIWTFGTMRTENFSQYIDYNTFGNWKFYKGLL